MTLADVAAASGVSVTTASLVLTGRARELRISEAAERRVRSTALDLGYRRGTLVTGPRPGRSRTIGFVLDTIASTGLAGDVLSGALEAAHRRGFVLFVGETGGDPVEERALFAAMCDRRADGIVLAAADTRVVALPDGPHHVPADARVVALPDGPRHVPADTRVVALPDGPRHVPADTRTVALPDGPHHVPAVLLNATNASRPGLPSVMPDERQGGRSAARVLVEAGHRRGVHLIGVGPRGVPPGGVAAVERLVGIREVFEAAGVEIAGAHCCPKWTPEDGYDATRRLLSAHRPRALVCFDDRLAFGAYQALAEAGLSVPGDVSVLGFGDHPVASWMRPRLTTVALPRHELGARAVGVLVEMLERRPRGVRSSLVHRVPMPLREGGSVAPPQR
ncbi:LacI family DNA-binding transcriptional regulator [Lentzea waywayandensis]|uniref:LacI family DNA-binding transcriptional regulator n=1 Tax=Lentzea waywayandensis TaxID=84724 RepID=UPI001C431C79|nr:LacI family DNA-binding transcriptional regulator [Lentzea waywayandensis]